jgi:hypothetical protein
MVGYLEVNPGAAQYRQRIDMEKLICPQLPLEARTCRAFQAPGGAFVAVSTPPVVEVRNAQTEPAADAAPSFPVTLGSVI